jgi:hypothetical protein
MSISCTEEQLNLAKSRAQTLLQSSLFELSQLVDVDIENIPTALLQQSSDLDDHLMYRAIERQVIALNQL